MRTLSKVDHNCVARAPFLAAAVRSDLALAAAAARPVSDTAPDAAAVAAPSCAQRHTLSVLAQAAAATAAAAVVALR